MSEIGDGRRMAPPYSFFGGGGGVIDAQHLQQLVQERDAMKAKLEHLAKQPHRYAMVLDVSKDRVTIRCDAGLLEIERPTTVKVEPGNFVICHAETFAILRIAPPPIGAGEAGSVVELIDDKWCEVSIGAARKIVMMGLHKVKRDDRV